MRLNKENLTYKQPDNRIVHLKHEPGFYGLFDSRLDKYVYIGYSQDLRARGENLISKAKAKKCDTISLNLRAKLVTIEKMPFIVPLTEHLRREKHLSIIYNNLTYPKKLGGAGYNAINPVTGKKFKKGG